MLVLYIFFHILFFIDLILRFHKSHNTKTGSAFIAKGLTI